MRSSEILLQVAGYKLHPETITLILSYYMNTNYNLL
jgi:hypothetical protein